MLNTQELLARLVGFDFDDFHAEIPVIGFGRGERKGFVGVIDDSDSRGGFFAIGSDVQHGIDGVYINRLPERAFELHYGLGLSAVGRGDSDIFDDAPIVVRTIELNGNRSGLAGLDSFGPVIGSSTAALRLDTFYFQRLIASVGKSVGMLDNGAGLDFAEVIHGLLELDFGTDGIRGRGCWRN